jgi:hypothetical protein
MIAVIRYTDVGREKRIVYGVLAQLNITIIKSQCPGWSIYPTITLQVENTDEINNILTILNRNSYYGVELVSCKKTFLEVLKSLFSKEEFI